MPRKFIIDTDTASDDAVALLMAFRAPDVEVVAVTTVAGNVPVEQAARNALIVTELCGVDVPVYIGAPKPMLRPYHDAKFFHGEDGLGDQGYPDPKRSPEKEHAVDALIAAALANPGAVLVTLGPLTNVALAVMKAPEIIPNISRCVVMGGAACTFGNVTPAAEYNIWCDPDAARIVFHSGLPVEMVGWEFCIGEHALSMAEMDAMRTLDTPFAHFTIDCNATAIKAYHKQTGEHGLSLPDPVAMAVALDPDVVTRRSEHYVDVETNSELTRGMTVVDRLNVAREDITYPVWNELIKRDVRIMVTWEIDISRWKALLTRLVT